MKIELISVTFFNFIGLLVTTSLFLGDVYLVPNILVLFFVV
jgi:hypothetical protein